MSLSNPNKNEIQNGDTAKVKVEHPFRTWISTPIRKVVCLTKGHTQVALHNIHGEEVVKTCLRCWKKFN